MPHTDDCFDDPEHGMTCFPGCTAAQDEQAGRILQVWQDSGRTVLAGPTVDDGGNANGWFARVSEGPVFRGESLTDALAQLTTWLNAITPDEPFGQEG